MTKVHRSSSTQGYQFFYYTGFDSSRLILDPLAVKITSISYLPAEGK